MKGNLGFSPGLYIWCYWFFTTMTLTSKCSTFYFFPSNGCVTDAALNLAFIIRAIFLWLTNGRKRSQKGGTFSWDNWAKVIWEERGRGVCVHMKNKFPARGKLSWASRNVRFPLKRKKLLIGFRFPCSSRAVLLSPERQALPQKQAEKPQAQCAPGLSFLWDSHKFMVYSLEIYCFFFPLISNFEFDKYFYDLFPFHSPYRETCYVL